MVEVDEQILYFAFRYAVQGHGHARTEVLEALRDNWGYLSESVRAQIQGEIFRAGEDLKEWTLILEK